MSFSSSGRLFRFVLLTGIIAVVSYQAFFAQRDELKASVPVDSTAKKVDLNTTKADTIIVPMEFTTTTTKVNLNTTTHHHPPSQEYQPENQTTSLVFTSESKILTFHRLKLRDRMGSRLQPALGAWALAQYWKNDTIFCLPAAETSSMAVMFPRCPGGPPKRMAIKFNLTMFNFMEDDRRPPESTPGVHVLHPTKSNTWSLIESYERKLPSSVWSTAVRQKWASMITTSSNHPQQHERLWKKDNSTIHVAVHVRRGDIRSDNKYQYAFIPDSEILEALKGTKSHIQRMLEKKQQQHNNTTIQVHLFSEDYGQTNNWTAYQDHVDHFHLAPEGGETIERNLRDWTHFVEADVLLVGGTFSAIPALGRLYASSNDTTATTMFPLTVYFPRVQRCFGHSSFWPEGWHLWAGNQTFESS